MNISLIEKEELTAEIHVLIAPEDYREQLDQEIKAQSKKLNIPGFRPGKIPPSLARKMVGRQAMFGVLNDLINHAVNDYLKDNDIDMLGEPVPIKLLDEASLDPSAGQEVDFAIEIGLAPKLDLDLMMDEKPIRYEIEVDDETLDKEIENLRDRLAETIQPEAVAEGDFLYGKLVVVAEDGNPIEDSPEYAVALNPQRIDKPGFFEPLVGMEVEDHVPIDIFSLADDHEALAKLLLIEEDTLATLVGQPLHFVLKRITRTTSQELDATFFRQVAERQGWEDPDTYDTIDAFRAQLREEMRKDYENGAHSFLHRQFEIGLLTHNPVKLPDTFLKRWYNKEKNLEEAALEREYEKFRKGLNWHLIMQQIAKLYPEVRVSEEEVVEGVRASVASLSGGASNPELEEMYMRYFLNNEEYVNRTANRLQTEKAMHHLEDKIDVETRTISSTAFRDLVAEFNKKIEADNEGTDLDGGFEEI
ncbi:MAG: trigger factor [Bacteroidia bacterium]